MSEQIDVFSECFDTNSDAKFERSEILIAINENFDEAIIDRKDEKNEMNRIFDCDANFELSNKKIIDCDDVEDEVEKVNELETTDFDFLI